STPDWRALIRDSSPAVGRKAVYPFAGGLTCAPVRARSGGRRALPGAVVGGGAVLRDVEAREALGDGRGHAAADADAFGRVLAVEVAGHLVELGEPPALVEGQQQVDAAQRLAEGALDAVAEIVEAL